MSTPRKSVEEKITEMFVTKELVMKIISTSSDLKMTTSLQGTPLLSAKVHEYIWNHYAVEINQEVGKRKFSFDKFKREVAIFTKIFFEEYLNSLPTDQPMLKL